MGINEITHPIGLKTTDRHVVNTDWVSPYQAGTVTDGVPNEDHYAVGGNHGTSGGGGQRSAHTVSTSISLDGETLPDVQGYTKGQKAIIVVENLVTLKSNINLDTGERLTNDFKETVTYTIEHNHMRVHVDVEALNPFYINWYMGLQMTRHDYRKDGYFTYDTGRPGLYNQSTSRLDSGTKGQSPNVNRITMRNDFGDAAHVYTDADYGIGYSHIGNDDVVVYLRESYLKLYYHLVKSGNRLFFNQGDIHSYRGGYVLSKNEAVTATNVSYFVEEGVRKALVDFKEAVTEDIDFSSVEESENVTAGTNKLTAITGNAYAKIVI